MVCDSKRVEGWIGGLGYLYLDYPLLGTWIDPVTISAVRSSFCVRRQVRAERVPRFCGTIILIGRWMIVFNQSRCSIYRASENMLMNVNTQTVVCFTGNYSSFNLFSGRVQLPGVVCTQFRVTFRLLYIYFDIF